MIDVTAYSFDFYLFKHLKSGVFFVFGTEDVTCFTPNKLGLQIYYNRDDEIDLKTDRAN